MKRLPVGSERGRTDRVTAVIVPLDGATRIPIRTGIEVRLWDPEHHQARPTRLVRNLGGQAVLLNEEADQDLSFRISTERSLYRGPVYTTFNPQQDGAARMVALERRTDASFDDIATLVRGVVVRFDPADGDVAPPVEGVTVSVHGVSGHQFPVTTDERGAFALPVDVGRPAPDVTPEISAEMHFAQDAQRERTVAVRLRHGRTHVFSRPIDLRADGTVPFTHQHHQE